MQNQKDLLYSYFAECSNVPTDNIGMEVETSFVTTNGKPISTATSQSIFRTLAERGWPVAENKGELITKLQNAAGDALLYELGRQNIELATIPRQSDSLVLHTRELLEEVYFSAEINGARPHFGPILVTTEDLLVIPDERDATWLELDGRKSLRPLATITAVQFTFDTTPDKAIDQLNRLGEQITNFLADYPQDAVWKEYIKSSQAKYRTDRYGGPLFFKDLQDYCNKLLEHGAVNGNQLTPTTEMESFSIPLFLRSVWWYFRLRRYGNRLCIEIRPMARRTDEILSQQLNMVLEIMK